MQIDARGVPIHTRTLSVTLRADEEPLVAFEGYVLDLRKRGFVPVGGDLQGTGIIHHMLLSGMIDRDARQIRSIHAEMPRVAFEATPATGGESCRDLVGRVDSLAGVPLDATYSRRIGAE